MSYTVDQTIFIKKYKNLNVFIEKHRRPQMGRAENTKYNHYHLQIVFIYITFKPQNALVYRYSADLVSLFSFKIAE